MKITTITRRHRANTTSVAVTSGDTLVEPATPIGPIRTKEIETTRIQARATAAGPIRLPGGGAPRLPTPTALSLTPTVPDPTKKSHARKRPPGHVPRPRNAFILFRCDFVRQQTIPQAVERDHRNLSRIAGIMWRGMTQEMRKPWIAMAEREKREHAERWPAYRYKPEGLVVPKRKVKSKVLGDDMDDDEEFEVGGDDDEYGDRRVRGRERAREKKRDVGAAVDLPHSQLTYTLPHRRSSSCPPPGSQVSQPTILPERVGTSGFEAPFTFGALPSHDGEAYGTARKSSSGMAQDDITTSRRPSRVPTFHSVHPVGSVFDTSLHQTQIGNPFSLNGSHESLGASWNDTFTFPWDASAAEDSPMSPQENAYTYSTAPTTWGKPFPMSVSTAQDGSLAPTWMSHQYSELGAYRYVVSTPTLQDDPDDSMQKVQLLLLFFCLGCLLVSSRRL